MIFQVKLFFVFQVTIVFAILCPSHEIMRFIVKKKCQEEKCSRFSIHAANKLFFLTPKLFLKTKAHFRLLLPILLHVYICSMLLDLGIWLFRKAEPRSPKINLPAAYDARNVS